MAVAIDVVGSSVNFDSAVSVTTSSLITVGASATLLLVGLTFNNFNNNSGSPSSPTGISVTWNGVTMTLIPNTSGAAGTWSSSSTGTQTYLYGLVNPASGAQSLNATWTNSVHGYIVAMSFTGSNIANVAAACPNGTTNTGASSATGSTTFSVTVTTNVGDFVAGVFAETAGDSWTGAGANCSVWSDNTSGAGNNLGSDYSTASAAGSTFTLGAVIALAGGVSINWLISATNITAPGAASQFASGQSLLLFM